MSSSDSSEDETEDEFRSRRKRDRTLRRKKIRSVVAKYELLYKAVEAKDAAKTPEQKKEEKMKHDDERTFRFYRQIYAREMRKLLHL